MAMPFQGPVFRRVEVERAVAGRGVDVATVGSCENDGQGGAAIGAQGATVGFLPV